MDQSKKKKYFFIAGPLVIFIALIGLTYAFFNYTRTGQANTLGTGRIFFNTTQGEALTLTNIFPMTATEAGNANLDSVTVGITGDTTYADGEEFQITIVDVENTVNNKVIPMNYIATYTAATGGTIGTSSNDYWNARNSKDATIYKLNATGAVEEDAQVLVGYIDNGATGISGTLTISAYIDADRIAISDTYYENATATPTPTAPNDQYGTTTEWVSGRTVLTTSEWNSLSSNPISFKIKAESNEGIWVEEPHAPTMEEMCPGCVFAYSTTEFWTTWNTNSETPASETPTVLTSSDYEENYEDVITSSGKNYFLGLKLNGSNQIEKAYACGLYNDETPFCIEGYYDDSKYEANQEILQNEYLWNNTCSVQTYDEGTEYEYEETYCASPSAGLVDVFAYSDGRVDAGVGGDGGCYVNSDGEVDCFVG